MRPCNNHLYANYSYGCPLYLRVRCVIKCRYNQGCFWMLSMFTCCLYFHWFCNPGLIQVNDSTRIHCIPSFILFEHTFSSCHAGVKCRESSISESYLTWISDSENFNNFSLNVFKNKTQKWESTQMRTKFSMSLCQKMRYRCLRSYLSMQSILCLCRDYETIHRIVLRNNFLMFRTNNNWLKDCKDSKDSQQINDYIKHW